MNENFRGPNHFKVAWFDQWNPQVAEALDALPAEDYSHDLYRQILQNPTPARKRIALLTDGGEPAAVVGLREKGHSWEPVTQWILPGAVFPAHPGCLLPALEALKVDIWVGLWRHDPGPLRSPMIRYIENQPVHRIHLSEDFEAYWRANGLFKELRLARNRCKDFTLAVNYPGSLEWTIRGWEARWRSDPNTVLPDLEDRLLALKYLQERERYFCFSLLDKGEIIAGNTVMVHRGDLVASVMYYKPEYHHYSPGKRLIDHIFYWAQASGYGVFDLGGDHEYKARWAPQDGEKTILHVCPTHLYYAKQAFQGMRGVIKRMRDSL